MNKTFYKEPEIKIISKDNQDILTTSTLEEKNTDWETSTNTPVIPL